MRKTGIWAARTVILVAALAAMFTIPSAALAVHTEGLFELDRDAVDSPLVAGDDWSNVFLGLGGFTSSSFVPQAVEGVGVDQTFFTGGGSKDVNDLDQWNWTTNDQTPDKDQIQDAFAASYTKDGDSFVYFGMDRYATEGTSDIGFWFFQSPASTNPDGTFSGVHTLGDILVLSEFTNGGSVNTITVYKWVGGKDPLELVASGADCSIAAAGDGVCATVNNAPIVPPWPYTSKGGSPGIIPSDAFFEGGINLNELFNVAGNDLPCFSTYAAETRSSSALNAQLKDFAMGSLNTCGEITVTKETDPAGANQDFSYTTTGTGLSNFTLNAGAAATTTKVFEKLHAGAFSIAEDALPAGWSFQDLTCTTDSGSSVTYDKANRKVDITLGVAGQADCTYSNQQQNPKLSLVKSATPSTYSAVGQEISYSYLVTNTGNVSLAGPVTVTDDKATVSCPNVNTVGNNDAFLDPNEQITCTASHTITQADLTNGSLTNTARATAGGTTSNEAKATVTAVIIPEPVPVAPPLPPAPRIDLAVTKTDTPDPASVGGRLTYSIIVH